MASRISATVLVVGRSLFVGGSLFLCFALFLGHGGSVVDEEIPTVEGDLESLVRVVTFFEQTYGRCPASLDEVVAKRLLDRSPVDFWGGPFRYVTLPASGIAEACDFYVWTLGRDGAWGGNGPDADRIAWPEGVSGSGLK